MGKRLELKGIVKDYKVADTKVRALKGVDLAFRANEFVSILGPSGCGKTTLLNIIGGLDRFTEGDLVIDGISTREYKDRDWDTYRNHRVGFVFQSYNLIPHQTILENVELALNISGVEKKERVQRAKEALDKVGLKDIYHKKPNQLSGGQCQRVAIARALVNEPEILLADEPTGALDTVTSVQIMDLIKEIAEERLVIMVTHNPELAEQYSTRIIRLLDGQVVDDSNPLTADEIAEVSITDNGSAESCDKTSDDSANSDNKGSIVNQDSVGEDKDKREKKKKQKKSKLTLWSAIKLSTRNLFSKWKRTLAVCLAGSIGIIGVASVLAVSTGIQYYIADMQEDMLSGNPITISKSAFDMSGLMSGMSFSDKQEAIEVENGTVNVQDTIANLVEMSKRTDNMMIQNDINQHYVDFIKEMPTDLYAAMSFNYGINLRNNIYTDIELEGYGETNMSLSAISQIYTDILELTDLKEYASMVTSVTDIFRPLPDNDDFILSQYDIMNDNGAMPNKSNQIVLVINGQDQLSNLILAQLGYYTQEEFTDIIYEALDEDGQGDYNYKTNFTYEELLGKKFVWYPNDQIYTPNESTNPMINIPFTYTPYGEDIQGEGMELEISAILKPKEGLAYGSLQSGLYYTEDLAQHVLQSSEDSAVVKWLVDNKMDGYMATASGDMMVPLPGSAAITYKYSYYHEGQEYKDNEHVVGSSNAMQAMMGNMMGGGQEMTIYTLSKNELGGDSLPLMISIYPIDFDTKDSLTAYLERWNADGDLVINGVPVAKEDRPNIVYTDNMEIVIDMITTMVKMITYALVAFTSLSLVVSTVMIAIITYVSVIERVKEIGVIRSLGGRKIDVANLFNAETVIIGGASGIVGIIITYILTLIINAVVKSALGIATIATLTPGIAAIMILVSVLLTSISGLIPASFAAKKDPVVALRSE